MPPYAHARLSTRARAAEIVHCRAVRWEPVGTDTAGRASRHGAHTQRPLARLSWHGAKPYTRRQYSCDAVFVEPVFITLSLFRRESEVYQIAKPDPEEGVVDRLISEYSVTHGQSLSMSREEDATMEFVPLSWHPRGDPDGMSVFTRLPRSATFRDLETAFGPDVHDERGPVWITITYEGGDSDGTVVPLPWPLRAIYWVTSQGLRLRDAEAFKDQREGVARWRNTGVIDSHLIALVRRNGFYWDANAFARQYGVSEAERGELLRASGYEWRFVEGPDKHYWVDTQAEG